MCGELTAVFLGTSHQPMCWLRPTALTQDVSNMELEPGPIPGSLVLPQGQDATRYSRVCVD